MGGGTAVKTWQRTEDSALVVVKQYYAQVATQATIPQSVLVIEEAEVANDAHHLVGGSEREAGSRRQRTFYAVNATVAPHTMCSVDVGKPHSRAVGIMNMQVFIKVLKLTFKISHRCHLREGRLIAFGVCATTVEQSLPT